MPNRLIHETSPYLLQHAHNPVNWEPWSPEAFQRAAQENKLVIISIGYSACHWCHVMERESFEDEQVARLMNEHFICIKVDREERPDVDQLFMDAAQLMIGRGGWPLNAFALSDGRPVYAGTYFPKIAWMGLLRELSFGYKKQPEKYDEYADKLIAGIKGMSVIPGVENDTAFSSDDLEEAFFSISQQIDKTYGGRGRAPKFPMPHNWLFLLRYHHATGIMEALESTLLTLDKMAEGGIYDQLGGGFARYATDQQWKVPHFEKMLYDNVQLISLYSEAYLITHKELYKKVVYETIAFLERELMSPEGAFYCALDADSEGIEGKFYIWTAEETERVCGTDAQIIKDHFGIEGEAYWENGENILLIAESVATLALKYAKTEKEIEAIIRLNRDKMLEARNTRIKPGLDHKILLSWNALAINGLLNAYKVFRESSFLALATKTFGFIRTQMIHNSELFHSFQNGAAKIPGFLEDYCFYIEALFNLYQVSFDEGLLAESEILIENIISKFGDPASGFFWFTSEENNELAARKIETGDNVIPSPNSVMAHMLHQAGILLDKQEYTQRSEKMLGAMISNIREQASFFSNWAILLGYKTTPFYEVAFTGEKAQDNAGDFEQQFHPNKIVAASKASDSNLSILKGKFIPGKSFIYICENSACLKPVEQVEEAWMLMR
jgi:uncharacterized protein